MPGIKRKSSPAASGAKPSKLAKRELGSSTTPALRKASTVTVEEKDAISSLPKKTSSKRVSFAKPSLTKKVSSVLVEAGTVTTIVSLKSGSSIGETSLATKTSLKKAASLTKSLSKTPSISAGSSAVVVPPLPPGGLLEVAISFDTTGSMYGVLKEVRAKVKDLVQRLQADIPGIRIAIIAHGDYCDADTYIVQWIDFGASLPELCDFVENVRSTGGGDGPECYELVLKRAREELAWTRGSKRVLVVIGDDEPHPVGYTYGGQTYNIDWKEECELLKQMGVKVYGVQSGYGTNATFFFSKMAELTLGRHVNLTSFSSIFDFFMMICYREGNPDMLPVYASEVRARHVGGMAKDMEALVKKFGGSSGFKTSFKVPPKPTAIKGAKASKALPKSKRSAKEMPKTAKTKIVKKPTRKATKKLKGAAGESNAKKALPKKPLMKIKGQKIIRHKKKQAPKQKRENLSDAKFLAGPLKKLEWSKWYLAICGYNRPKGYSISQFRRSRRYGWEDSFLLRNIFDPARTPAIFEVGVRFPEEARRKIYVMYFKCCYTFTHRIGQLDGLKLIRENNARKEILNVVKNNLKIYIRRGLGNTANVKAAVNYLNRFDYAWGWKRRSKHRKVVKHAVVLSQN